MSEARRDPWLLGLLAAVLLVSTLSLPAVRYDGDVNAWEMEAESLVHRGQLAVRAAVAESLPRSAPYFVFNPESGQWYSKYGIGNTLIYSIPLAFERFVLGRSELDPPGSIFGATTGPYDITRRLGLFNAFNLLLVLALASTLYRLTRLYTDRPQSAVVYVLACLYATYLWNYTRAHSSQIYQVLFFSLAMLHWIRFAREDRDANLRGCTLALVALASVKLVFLPLLGVFALATLAIGREPGTNPLAHGVARLRENAGRYAIQVGIPIAALAVLLLVVNDIKFGSPLRMGYEREANLFGGSLAASVPAYLFRPRFSVFVHFPILAFALLGLPALWRKHAGEVALAWAAFLTMFGLYANYTYWMGEASYGPRYLLFGLPVLALPLVAWLDALAHESRAWRRGVATGAFIALVATSLYAQVLANRLEFHTFFRLRTQFLTLAPSDPELVAYLRDENTALFHRDFLRYRDGGPKPFPLLHLEAKLGAERSRQLEAAVRAYLASNHLFF